MNKLRVSGYYHQTCYFVYPFAILYESEIGMV